MQSPKIANALAIVLFLLVLPCVWQRADAQMFGARADAESLQAAADEAIDHRAIENFITIEGKAEERVDATALRIVLALLVEKPTASECQAASREREAGLLAALERTGVARGNIVVDFISILPVYDWEVETRQETRMAVEKRDRYRMQSNVHVEVATEQKARAVLDAAFALEVADIIAFDYWNENIDELKRQARRKALEAAKEKADMLLGAMFDQRPQPLNVHESTRVVFPRNLYSSFENTYAQQIDVPYNGPRLPTLRAARPKNTYYRGFQEEADVRAKGLPLKPRISVVSTVRLYYATPVAFGGRETESTVNHR